MADPYEQFMAGVPDVRSSGGRSVFQNSPMSSRSRQMLSTNRMAATGAILEARDRMEQFRASQRARTQAPAAMGALSQLDPMQDPYYDQRVAQVFTQYPDAATDETVQKFLNVQGGIFDRSRAERDYAQEQADREAAREAERLRREQDLRKGRRMEAKEKTASRIESLPLEAQKVVETAVSLGATRKDAIAQAEMELAQEAEINSLFEAGLSEEEIMGGKAPDGTKYEGVLDDAGKIDQRKKAKLIGRSKVQSISAARAKEERANDERMLKLLTSYLRDADPAEAPAIEADIRGIKEKLGLSTNSTATGDATPAGPSSGDPILDKINASLPTKF